MKRHAGIALMSCNKGEGFYEYPYAYSSPRYRYTVTRTILIAGLLIENTLILIGIIYVLGHHMDYYAQQTYSYTYKYYGIMCGVTCSSLLMLPIAAIIIILNCRAVKPVTIGEITYYVALLMTAVCPTFVVLPIAIYFAYKTKPPAIPYILMLPVSVLFCCCNTKRAKSLVFGVGLWVNLATLLFAATHGTIIAFTILAEPFTVITNTMVLILSVFCITNIFALMFVISAYIFSPSHQRPEWQRKQMKHAVILVALLAMVMCFCVALASSSYARNTASQQGSERFIASITFPLILGVLTFILTRIIGKWLQATPSNNHKSSHTGTESSTGCKALTGRHLEKDNNDLQAPLVV